MERPCVIVGKERTPGSTFAKSGHSSVLDFFSSTARQYGVLYITEPDKGVVKKFNTKTRDRDSEAWMSIFAARTRIREETREVGSFVRLLQALPSLFTELVVDARVLVSEEEISALCSGIASPSCRLAYLDIEHFIVFNPDVDPFQTHITNALINNTFIHSVCLDIERLMPSPARIVSVLSRNPCPIKSLSLGSSKLSAEAEALGLSEIFRLLSCNTISLTVLEVGTFYFRKELNSSCIAELGTMLQNNTSLRKLRFYGYIFPGDVLRMLFTSLEQNAHLTHFSLWGCEGSDWPTESFVLDCLRVNGTLTSIDLRGTPLHGKSERAINAQLERNKRRVEEQVRVFQEQGSASWVQPNTMRLFLCGLPFSGKTTLAKSLVRWSSNSTASFMTSILSCLKAGMPERTRGIEVSTVEKGGVRVSLWDMAGQSEYYAFHDHMFPNLSNDATPSLFLYVWNPVKLHPSTGKETQDAHGRHIVKDLDSFEGEFRYWLRFIASKTLHSSKFKPKIITAITRADLLKFNVRSYIHNAFQKCQTDFQEHIQLDMGDVFDMDARDPHETKRLGVYIFQCATSILKSKPPVYEACTQARRALAESVHSKSVGPLVTKQEFFGLCKKCPGLDTSEIQEAVALSLNDSGDVIYFKDHELVVIDTQWFCHSFMGDLLYFSNNASQQRGFFSPRHLEDLLQSKITNLARGYRTIFSKGTRSPRIKGEDLVKLLIGLQLACQQDDTQVNSEIFIPASLCTKQRRQISPHMYLKGDERIGKAFVGRRLKCKDSIRMFFTPGIFTLLQVSLNNTFIRVKPTLEEDVIAFSQDGVKVLVEFCKHEGQDHFIDVLIHSPLDLDNTIRWAQEELLDKMENICANPRGIQGVQLVYEVLRPSSVQELENMEARLSATVSLEDLCKKLRDALEKKGTETNCLENVFHDWPSPWNDLDHVRDLLGNMQTLEIVKDFREKFLLDVEDVSSISVVEEVRASTSEPDMRVFGSSNSGKERMWIHDDMREGFQKIDKGIQEVRKDIHEVQKEIAKLVRDVQKLRSDVLPEISEKVQKLLTFNSWEGEAAKIPRLFVITKDDGLVRKIVGAMVPGLQNVRLELLCEHRRRPHLVTGKRGLSFATLEDGLLKQGLPYVNMFLKLASMAVKLGAHVLAPGVGGVVPDFGRLLALVIDSREFASFPTHLSFENPEPSRLSFQASQRWLYHVLSKRNCTTSTEILDVFGLLSVRYRDSQNVAWLCEKHAPEGEICPN